MVIFHVWGLRTPENPNPYSFYLDLYLRLIFLMRKQLLKPGFTFGIIRIRSLDILFQYIQWKREKKKNHEDGEPTYDKLKLGYQLC